MPNVTELLKTNRMSHFMPFYDDFFLQKVNFKGWIFHSALICGPRLWKLDGMMKTRLATNIWQISYKVESNMIYSLRGAKHRVDYSVHIRWNRYLLYYMVQKKTHSSAYVSVSVNSWTIHSLSLDKDKVNIQLPYSPTMLGLSFFALCW